MKNKTYKGFSYRVNRYIFKEKPYGKEDDPYYANIEWDDRPILYTDVEWSDGIKRDRIDLNPAPRGTSYHFTCSWNTDSETSKTVDLGLPSGTLWATRNLGAAKADDYGDYFAWGEVRPKATYTRDNYKHYCRGRIVKYSYPTYCEEKNIDDGRVALELGDDAASSILGPHWRIPTLRQAEELKEKCEWLMAFSNNGVDGVVAIGPNGNVLFLPFAGSKLDDKLYDEGREGSFWTSCIHRTSPTKTHPLCFDGRTVGFGWGSRYIGAPVRPVYIG